MIPQIPRAEFPNDVIPERENSSKDEEKEWHIVSAKSAQNIISSNSKL
jgi:hypothetical protein